MAECFVEEEIQKSNINIVFDSMEYNVDKIILIQYTCRVLEIIKVKNIMLNIESMFLTSKIRQKLMIYFNK